MVTREETLRVGLEMPTKQSEKFTQHMELAEDSARGTLKYLKEVAAQFKRINKLSLELQKKENLGKNPAYVAKQIATGGPLTQLINADVQGQKNRIKATTEQIQSTIINTHKSAINNINKAVKNYSVVSLIDKYSGTDRNITRPSANAETLKTQIAAQEYLLSQRKLSGASAASIKRAEAALGRLTAQQQRYNNALKQESAIANAKARLNNEELNSLNRQNKVNNVLGDGGASLFKIQAGLLGNYLIMNKIFQLFSFGSQFIIELDQAFTQLQAITATTSTEMEVLKRELIAVSEQTKFTAVEVAQAATVLGQAGFSTTEIKESIEDVTLLATAVGTDLKSAVDLTTSTLSIFNLRAEETGHVANVLTGAINNSKLTLDKLSLGLQFAGNTAAQAGATFEETVAVLGAMANAGIRSGSTLGTGLRQILVSFLKPTEKMNAELDKLGLTMEDLDVESKGLVNVFETLTEAGFGASAAFNGMQVRAAAAFLAVSNNLDVARDLEDALLLTNAAAEANQVQMTSLTNTFDKFKSILGTVITNFFEPIKDGLIIITSLFGKLLTTLNKLGVILPAIGIALTVIASRIAITKLGVLAKNLFLVGNNGKIAGAGLTLAGAGAGRAAIGVKALNIALTASGGPLGLFILAVTAAVAGAKKLGQVFGVVAKDLDSLRAEVDKTTGALETTTGRIQSVDETLDRLSKRYDLLTNNSRALDSEILKAQVTFGNLGIKLDSNIDSVEELSDALRDLKDRLLDIQGLDIEAKAAAQDTLLRGQLENLKKQLDNPASPLPDHFTNGRLEKIRDIAEVDDGLRERVQELLNINISEFTENEIQSNLLPALLDADVTISKKINKMSAEIENMAAINSQGVFGGGGVDALKITQSTIDKASEVREGLILTLSNIRAIAAGFKGKKATINESDINQIQKTDAVRLVNERISLAKTQNQKLKDTLAGIKDNSFKRELALSLKKDIEDIRDFSEEKILEFVDLDKLHKELGKEITKEQLLDALKPQITEYVAQLADEQATVKDAAELATKARVDIQEGKLKLLENQKKLFEQDLKNADDPAFRKSLFDAIDEIINKIVTTKVNLLSLKGEGLEGDAKANNELEKQLAVKEGETQHRTLRSNYRKSGNRALNVEEELTATVDELANIKTKAEEATRGIDLQIARLQSQIEANDVEGPLKDLYDSVDIRRFEKEIETLELGAMKAQQDALRTQLAETEALVKERELQFETAKAASLADRFSQDKLDNAKDAQKRLQEAREAAIDTNRELAETEAILAGRVEQSADSMGTAFQKTIESIGYWKEDLDQFDIGQTVTEQMDNARGAFATFVGDVSTGTKSIKESFSDMAINVLQSLQKMATDRVANKIFDSVVGFGLNLLGGAVGGGAGAETITWNPLNDGGFVKANNGYQNPNRDSVPVLARPGEAILRNSAVQMIGRDNLRNINAMGNRRISTGVPSINPNSGESQGGGMVNVYVVSPDQKPSLTAQDVLVTITDDLAKGGNTKKLVKAIQMGKV